MAFFVVLLPKYFKIFLFLCVTNLIFVSEILQIFSRLRNHSTTHCTHFLVQEVFRLSLLFLQEIKLEIIVSSQITMKLQSK